MKQFHRNRPIQRVFKIVAIPAGFRIVEVVGQSSNFGRLTIQWDGLFENENNAVQYVEIELGLKLKRINASTYENDTTPVRPVLRRV